MSFCLGLLVVCAQVSPATAEPAPGQDSTAASLSATASAPLVTMDALAVSTSGGARIGLRYRIAPGWHIYWENPGDSGMATSAEVTPPSGWRAGPLLFPGPEAFSSQEIVSYGYSQDVVLFVDLTRAEAASDGEVAIASRWLVCKDLCEPGSSDVMVSLADLPTARAEFAASAARLPRAPRPDEGVEVTRTAQGFEVVVPGAQAATFFPTVDLELGLGGKRASFLREEIVNSRAIHRLRANISAPYAERELYGIARIDGVEGPTYLSLRIPPSPEEP